MTTQAKQDLEHQQRREATIKARAEGAKTPGQVGMGMKNMFFQTNKPGYFTEENMAKAKILRAKCPRMAGMSTVIGNTVFSFDAEGMCRKISEGHSLYDFDVLCSLNGVTRIEDDIPVAELAKTLTPLKVVSPIIPDVPSVTSLDVSDEGEPDLVVPAQEDDVMDKNEKKKFKR